MRATAVSAAGGDKATMMTQQGGTQAAAPPRAPLKSTATVRGQYVDQPWRNRVLC
jgi:hypothetical protein